MLQDIRLGCRVLLQHKLWTFVVTAIRVDPLIPLRYE